MCTQVGFHFNNTFSGYPMRDFSIFNILTLTPPTVYIYTIHPKTNWIYSRVVKEGPGGRGTYQASCQCFLSYHESQKKVCILLTMIWGKSEVAEQERMARSWCHNYAFLMSLLLVSNDINHHGNFKRCENSKSHIRYAARPNHASRG